MKKQKQLFVYWLCALAAALILSCYPIIMGVRVLVDMVQNGTVSAEHYPKYIIPYTPISIAVIFGILLMPLLICKCKKTGFLFGGLASVAVFFASELCLERLVTVTKTHEKTVTSLENWQMYMCYVQPKTQQSRQWTEVNVLLGEYSPAFKLHFYLISVLLILALLNAVYGFAKMLFSGDNRRKKALILQSVTAAAFLGMCIWACFTAFYRNGDLKVSAVSALLMSVFFLLFGVTAGIFLGSFLLEKQRGLSVLLPSAAAMLTVIAMYIGEMILLSGHLYRFGSGFFFDGLPQIIMAPVDILVVLTAGLLTFGSCTLLRR